MDNTYLVVNGVKVPLTEEQKKSLGLTLENPFAQPAMREKYYYITSEGNVENEYDRIKLAAIRRSINFYEEKIKQLLEMKNNEEDKFVQFLKDCINSTPGIEKYQGLGAIIMCENCLFLYDGEGWCPCRKVDDR